MTDDQLALLNDAKDFAEDHSTASYLLVYSDKNRIEKMNFSNGVGGELCEIAGRSIENMISSISNDESKLRELTAAATVDSGSYIQHTHINNLPDTKLFTKIVDDVSTQPGAYDEDNPPDFQVIRTTDGDKVLMGIQNHSSLQKFSLESGLPLINRITNNYNQAYEQANNEILVIPDSLNAVYFNSNVFIRTAKSFERIFNMREKYEEVAEETINDFESNGVVIGNKRLKNDWIKEGEIRVLRKMYEINANDISKHASPKEIKELIERYPVDVNYDIADDGSEIELTIDQYSDIWQLLDVLNVNYAEAEIISRKLKINDKEII